MRKRWDNPIIVTTARLYIFKCRFPCRCCSHCSFLVDYFTVECLVFWPLNESEAGVDPAFLNCVNLHKKRSEVSIKTRSTLSFKGQATKYSTVKWYIYLIPKWRPINYSFVCMLITPLRLIFFFSKFYCVFIHVDEARRTN